MEQFSSQDNSKNSATNASPQSLEGGGNFSIDPVVAFLLRGGALKKFDRDGFKELLATSSPDARALIPTRVIAILPTDPAKAEAWQEQLAESVGWMLWRFDATAGLQLLDYAADSARSRKDLLAAHQAEILIALVQIELGNQESALQYIYPIALECFKPESGAVMHFHGLSALEPFAALNLLACDRTVLGELRELLRSSISEHEGLHEQFLDGKVSNNPLLFEDVVRAHLILAQLDLIHEESALAIAGLDRIAPRLTEWGDLLLEAVFLATVSEAYILAAESHLEANQQEVGEEWKNAAPPGEFPTKLLQRAGEAAARAAEIFRVHDEESRYLEVLLAQIQVKTLLSDRDATLALLDEAAPLATRLALDDPRAEEIVEFIRDVRGSDPP
jgi:hypothetical protein